MAAEASCRGEADDTTATGEPQIRTDHGGHEGNDRRTTEVSADFADLRRLRPGGKRGGRQRSGRRLEATRRETGGWRREVRQRRPTRQPTRQTATTGSHGSARITADERRTGDRRERREPGGTATARAGGRRDGTDMARGTARNVVCRQACVWQDLTGWSRPLQKARPEGRPLRRGVSAAHKKH